MNKSEIHNLIKSRIDKVFEPTARNNSGPQTQNSNKSNELRESETTNQNSNIKANKPSKGGGVSAVSRPPAEEINRGCVLLIDDSPVAAKVATKVLENLKFQVVSCNSAQSGFDKLKESPSKFSIVFLDVVMPKVDGVECLSWIKDDPEIAHVPVYMLSGLEDQTLAGLDYI